MSREPGRYLRTGGLDAAARLGLYGLIVMMPLVFAWAGQPTTDHPPLQEAAKAMALVGFSILALQPVLAARYRWVERPFGLDAVYGFHRRMGVFAGVLLIAHPVVYAGGGEWNILWTFTHGWPIALGKLALLLLLVLVATSVFRQGMGLEFERWRGLHNGLAVGVLVLGFVHGVAAGGDFGEWPARIGWSAFFVGSLLSYVFHMGGVLPGVRQAEFSVARVSQTAERVWSVELHPSRPELGLDFLPGQFMFLTLHRDGHAVEEHPFTIASAPSPTGAVTATIKQSGDFTRTVHHTKVGDLATARGPYGRFSYLLQSTARPLVFIAGGAGVTPFLSMLRHMRDTQAQREVLLIYGNCREEDIIAQAELNAIAYGQRPKLKVVHILSRASESWPGKRGRIGLSLVEAQCGSLQGRDFYVSGPPAMIRAVTGELRAAGVSIDRIHVERFDL